jgi:DNA-binding transcriptional LysR family regulator
MDRFQEMQVFAAVVDAGSFVRAADALGMSKPAVSRHVAELEARLGARLLQRTTRKLSLTAEGEVFYGRCKALLADVEEAEAEILSRTAQATGVLKINVPVSFGRLKLAALWGPFMARHPKVRLDVALADRFVDLVEEGYDMAIRIARLPSSTLVSRKLATTRSVLCASPKYLRARGIPKHPSELTQHEILSYSLLSAGNTWAFEGPDGLVSVDVVPRMWSNSGDTLRVVALTQGGIILQPSFLVDEDLRAGTLAEVLPDYRGPEFDVCAVYPTRKHLTPKVRLLVDDLAAALASDGADGKTPPHSEGRRDGEKAGGR